MLCCTQCPRPCSRPPPTHASARVSWTLTDKSGSVSCGPLLLSLGSWCTQGFVCALQESVSPVLCKFWQLYGGVNGDLLQKVLCTQRHTQCPQPCSRLPPTHASTEDSWMLTGKSRSVSCGVTAPFSWVLVHKVLFVPSRSLLPVLCKF